MILEAVEKRLWAVGSTDRRERALERKILMAAHGVWPQNKPSLEVVCLILYDRY